MKQTSFLSWSIFRPVTVMMFFIVFLVAGIIAYNRIPLQMMPDGIIPPRLTISVPYPNSNPADVEKKITRPIEEMVGTIQGVDEIRSNSESSGSRVRINFKASVDLNVMYNQLQDRMERLMIEFPEDVERYEIRKFSFQDFPVQYLGIFLKDDASNPKNQSELLQELVGYSKVFDRNILSRLEQEDGIAKVDLHGTYNKKIYVDLIPDRIESHHINVFDLVQRLRNSNVNVTQGKIEDRSSTFLVRSLGKFLSLKDLQEFPVQGELKLKDIANIRLSNILRSYRVRINALPALYCEIYKESQANTVEVCRKVHQIVENFKKDPRLAKFDFTFLHDEGKLIEDALQTLQETLLWGGLFAVIVLFFFLQSLRMTLLITMSIPISLMMGLVVVHANGNTLNLISLMGFTLAVGMLLDNAVVVVENIYRYFNQGKTLQEAAILGVNEVGLAILLATSTTLVVFLPAMVMSEGGEQVFMTEIGGAVCYSLIASLIVAIVFIPPTLYLIEGKRHKNNGAQKKYFAFLNIFIQKSEALYARALAWVMKHRFETIMFIFIPFIFVTWQIREEIGQTDQQQGIQRGMRISFGFTDTQDIYKNSDLLLKIEEAIMAKKKELEIVNMLSFCMESFGMIRIWFTEGDDIQKTTEELGKEIENMLPPLPGVKVRGNWRQSSSGGNSEEGDVPIVIRGEDPETLREIGLKVEALLQDIPELLEVGVEESQQGDEVVIKLQRQLVQRHNISPQQLAGTVSYALRGSVVSQFQSEEEEIPIEVQFSQEMVDNVDMLSQVKIFNQEGEEVVLNNISHISYEKGFATIRRQNRKVSFTVNATASKDDLASLGEKIEERLEDLELPRGYTINKEGRFVDIEENQNAFLQSILLAVVLVFLLMGFLFESFVLPFSIILSIPFAFVGVYWILYLTDTPMGMMVYLGNIILAGVVVNNGIVLVDYINRLRRDGMERGEAILNASTARFRPIMMTSLTTLFGLLPMAIGDTSFSGTPYYPLGRTVIGGLTMSTLLTLLIVPIFYVFFDDLRHNVLRILSNVFAHNSK